MIPGCFYIPDFIDAAEEAALLYNIDAQDWSREFSRRVQHHGFRYDYKARNISETSRPGDLPLWLQAYCLNLFKMGWFQQVPDQIIVNEYQPSQGIASHIDCIPCFAGTIASLSLGSNCVMDFVQEKDGRKTSILLEPRSLLILRDEARYRWKHGIAARKTDRHGDLRILRGRRVSLTFRNVIAKSH